LLLSTLTDSDETGQQRHLRGSSQKIASEVKHKMSRHRT
jgi:hypothetical protein